jgi:hypothetical protein
MERISADVAVLSPRAWAALKCGSPQASSGTFLARCTPGFSMDCRTAGQRDPPNQRDPARVVLRIATRAVSHRNTETPQKALFKLGMTGAEWHKETITKWGLCPRPYVKPFVRRQKNVRGRGSHRSVSGAPDHALRGREEHGDPHIGLQAEAAAEKILDLILLPKQHAYIRMAVSFRCCCSFRAVRWT